MVYCLLRGPCIVWSADAFKMIEFENMESRTYCHALAVGSPFINDHMSRRVIHELCGSAAQKKSKIEVQFDFQGYYWN